ncbi:MAG: putative signal transducing protein [Planctomycetota bacterium]|jgi:hypothetical protein
MSDPYQTVAAFSTPIEANFAVALLESEGIPCMVLDENVPTMTWHFSQAIGGVKVLVPEERIEDAEYLLERDRNASAESSRTQADPLRRPKSTARRAYEVSLFGMVAFPLGFYAFWLILAAIFGKGAPQLSAEERKGLIVAFFLSFLQMTVMVLFTLL